MAQFETNDLVRKQRQEQTKAIECLCRKLKVRRRIDFLVGIPVGVAYVAVLFFVLSLLNSR